MRALSFDIFCRVVDNFGDIGVCWRLSRQLAGIQGVADVRLWVDDLDSFARIEPLLAPASACQRLRGVDIRSWRPDTCLPPARDVVIEAFACDPPPAFIQSMTAQDSLWINLEYLSAEDWVEHCHAMPSLQAHGLRKAFFFPGFTRETGGLLREEGLLVERDRWLADPDARTDLLQQLNLPSGDIQSLASGKAQQIMLFCYPDAPAQALLDTLNLQQAPAIVLVPQGVCPGLLRGPHGKVLVRDIPFVDQAGFDRLLWSSALNCVRGEDSLVRALWAGRPLLWHIYPQQDQAHQTKLQAWLARSSWDADVRLAMSCWNSADAPGFSAALARALQPAAQQAWRAASAAWSHELAQQTDLANSLLAFCQASEKPSKALK